MSSEELKSISNEINVDEVISKSGEGVGFFELEKANNSIRVLNGPKPIKTFFRVRGELVERECSLLFVIDRKANGKMCWWEAPTSVQRQIAAMMKSDGITTVPLPYDLNIAVTSKGTPRATYVVTKGKIGALDDLEVAGYVRANNAKQALTGMNLWDHQLSKINEKSEKAKIGGAAPKAKRRAQKPREEEEDEAEEDEAADDAPDPTPKRGKGSKRKSKSK